jgi:hypothetical protein
MSSTLTASLVLACVMCITGCTGLPENSGVSGVTVVDQGCPVIYGSTPCPTQPLRAQIVVVRPPSATVVAQVVSDSDGRFRIPLPPGHYTVNPQNLNSAPLPVARPQQVDVHAGSYTEVTVHFDSGVRQPG